MFKMVVLDMNIQRIIVSLCLIVALSIIAPARLLRAAAESFHPHGSAHIPATMTRTTVVPSWLMPQTQAAAPQDPNWWRQGRHINPRNDFVRDLIGMPEDTFRHLMGWPHHNQFKPKLTKSGNWVADWADIDGQCRRAAVYQGKLASNKVTDWANFASDLGSLPTKGKGYFSIHFDDPQLPWESDIRYLQSIPEHKYAAFQIASTFFGPLEGGITDSLAKLENMFPHAAQGEEATAATAGATFYRKYCMEHGLYLLYHVKKLPMYKHKTRKGRTIVAVDNNALKSYHNDANDIGNVLVVAHDNIAVTGGYGPYEGRQG